MALLQLRKATLSFGGDPLLDGVELAIEPGERLCLVGRNGTGKSTLLKVIAGELPLDDGERSVSSGAVVSRLTQAVPEDIQGSVYDVVAEGLGESGQLLSRYHVVSQQLAEQGSESLLGELERIQHKLESCGGWSLNQRVETVLSRLSLPADADFASLSGGLKRRVLLARVLVQEPDLLLLDEPTNHLDIEAIKWLEEFLLSWRGTLLFITHDRMFLQHLATRIIELDRGQLSSWPGDYATYLRRKEEALEVEAQQNALFDKRLAQEEAWIRQGIKARRTRNEGRVRALKTLREERKERRELGGKARLQVQDGDLSGKVVVEAKGISYAYDSQPVIREFSTTILRGDKVGIIGPNGAGKTTLLNLLLGKLEPDSGSIKLGTRLEVAYFDQHRAQFDENASVFDNVAEGRTTVTINGADRHMMSYLQDFLFPPERARGPVKALSGGERNRLLLAKLFLKPANVLVMDEPTNDLDVETLELLEELLLDYQGTLLLVSHDRAFLNSVVTSTLVFEGEGRVAEYVGGYDDWLRQRPAAERTVAKPHKAATIAAPAVEKKETKKAKLSYKEKRELEQLPDRIAELEAEQDTLQQQMADPGFYQQQSGEAIAQATERLEQLGSELEQAYERWEELAQLEG